MLVQFRPHNKFKGRFLNLGRRLLTQVLYFGAALVLLPAQAAIPHHNLVEVRPQPCITADVCPLPPCLYESFSHDILSLALVLDPALSNYKQRCEMGMIEIGNGSLIALLKAFRQCLSVGRCQWRSLVKKIDISYHVPIMKSKDLIL